MRNQALRTEEAPGISAQIFPRAITRQPDRITVGSRVQRWSRSRGLLRFEGYVERIENGKALVVALAAGVRSWIPVEELSLEGSSK